MNRNTTMCFKYCEEKSFFIKVRTVNFDRISDHQGQIDKLFWHDIQKIEYLIQINLDNISQKSKFLSGVKTYTKHRTIRCGV